MTRKSEWPKGTDVQKVGLSLPRKLWEEGRIRAMREERTFQELVAEALAGYLKRAKKGDRNGD